MIRALTLWWAEPFSFPFLFCIAVILLFFFLLGLCLSGSWKQGKWHKYMQLWALRQMQDGLECIDRTCLRAHRLFQLSVSQTDGQTGRRSLTFLWTSQRDPALPSVVSVILVARSHPHHLYSADVGFWLVLGRQPSRGGGVPGRFEYRLRITRIMKGT